ncbi:glycerate kinase, partial [Pyxidicoccus sp. 3LFB2]
MSAAGKRRWLIVAMAVVGVLCACRSADGAVASALFNTGIAMGAAAAQRAAGGCYASCPVGTACDGETGYCLPLPCRGRCRSDERCVQLGPEERCEALALPEGGLDGAPRSAGRPYVGRPPKGPGTLAVISPRWLVAPQEFKGTLTAAQAAEAMAKGIRESLPEVVLDVAPLADG